MAKILIVDDDPDITFATELFLKKAQHEVRTAANRAEGMKAVDEWQPGPDHPRRDDGAARRRHRDGAGAAARRVARRRSSC